MRIIRSPGGGKVFHLLDDAGGILGKFTSLADAVLVRRYVGGTAMSKAEKLDALHLLRQLDGERNE